MAERSRYELSDDALIALMKSRPREGFTALFERYYEETCRHIYRYIPDVDIVADVAQELYTELWTKRDSLEIKSSPGVYLHRMATTRALNYLRDNKKHLYASEEPLISVKAKSQMPDQKLEADQLSVVITKAIDNLPERCRLVFMMSRFEEMSNAQIAAALDISVKTVENQMTKALRALRETVANYRNDE